MEETIDFIKKEKYKHYSNIIGKISYLMTVFAHKNDMILFNVDHFKELRLLESPKEYMGYYAKDTVHKVKEFMEFLNKECFDGSRTLHVFAKRINDNTIDIRFRETNTDIDFKIQIINLIYWYDLVLHNSLNGTANLEVILHNVFHRICFPQTVDYNLFYSAEAIIEAYLDFLKEVPLKKRGPFRDLKQLEYKLNEKNNNLIPVGWIAIEPILEKHVDIPFIEYIHPEPKLIAKNMKINTKFNMGDFEFDNGFLDIKKDNKVMVRIYSGKGFCYPVGTWCLLMKFLMIDILRTKKPEHLRYVAREMIRKRYKFQFASPVCIGETVTSYEKYYLKNWGKSPWSYSKNIKFE